MKDRIKSFYLMPGVWRTVTESQVFNWIKLMNENGLKTDCISLSKKHQSQSSVIEIERNIKGRFFQYRPYPIIINDVYLFFILFKHYFNNYRNFDKIIFQSRMPSIGRALILLKIFPKVKVIFESRGATIEESKYVNDKALSLKSRIRSKLKYHSEKLLIKKSTKIICVSNALKKYYIKKFNVDGDRFFTMGGVADYEFFYYSKKLRDLNRSKLNYFENDIVVVYAGALGMKWEIPDEMFNFMANLRLYNDKLKYLIITPDIDIADRYTKKYNASSYIKIIKSPFKNVNLYLNASDIALLLRDNVIMNNVSSPTKFSEYLLSGLPTIISQSIHDFSKIVDSTSFGVVLSDYNNISDGLGNELDNLKTIDREIISNWGKNNLSKQAFLEKYLKFFYQI